MFDSNSETCVPKTVISTFCEERATGASIITNDCARATTGWLVQVATEGETYYRYGVLLKKVANFYNNMASQASVRVECVYCSPDKRYR